MPDLSETSLAAAEALAAEQAAKTAACLIGLARSGELEISAARVGRFYGDGLCWALALPLPALLRRASLIVVVERSEVATR